jgi:hypothetical protein
LPVPSQAEVAYFYFLVKKQMRRSGSLQAMIRITILHTPVTQMPLRKRGRGEAGFID